MKGAVHNYLNEFFEKNGYSSHNLIGLTKMRSIRVQITLKGLNLGNFDENTDDSQESLDKLKSILNSMNLGIKK